MVSPDRLPNEILALAVEQPLLAINVVLILKGEDQGVAEVSL